MAEDPQRTAQARASGQVADEPGTVAPLPTVRLLLGVVVEPVGKLQKALAIGIIFWLILEGPAFYRARYGPKGPKEGEGSVAPGKPAASAAEDQQSERGTAIGQEDGSNGSDKDGGVPSELSRKSKSSQPAARPRLRLVEAGQAVTADQAYHAMQTGAAAGM